MLKILASTTIIMVIGVIIFSNQQLSSKRSLQTNSPQPQISPTPPTQTADIQASFAIFTNSTFRVFTAKMYHNLSPDAYIEAQNPNIVQVKKTGITWHDFFTTLPFTLTSTCLTTGTRETFCTGETGALQFYLNGVKNDDALSHQIQNGDKLLVTFGNASTEQIRQQLDQIP